MFEKLLEAFKCKPNDLFKITKQDPMETKLIDTLIETLKKDARFVTDEGELLKNTIREKAEELDTDLIWLLLENDTLRAKFFIPIKDVIVFDTMRFVKFINNKEFLPDSFTSFKNKIGLTNKQGDFIASSNEVVLSFPYKDCVLAGWQDKEDSKREEVFYNEILWSDDIDRLLDEKVFTDFKRIDTNGEHELQWFTRDTEINKARGLSDDTITDNLIIKWNNLLALHSLKKNFAGKVKLIYIDPPYNTWNDTFGYNDRFNHSTWLTFMKNRLEAARELLKDNGAIFISIDDDESHYLKVQCDEIFGRENFVANIVWQKKYWPANDAKWFSDSHDHILVFAKNKNNWKPNLLARTGKQLTDFKNPDNDSRGIWRASDLSAKTPSQNCMYPITWPNGSIYFPPKTRSWVVSEQKYKELLADNRIWFWINWKSRPMIKKFLTEVKDWITPETWWNRDIVWDNKIARYEMKELFPDNPFWTPKPEKLLKRIIEIWTKENDVVLDFFGGSGTTGAVAHKMNRQYILTEQMDYIKDLPEARLIKVIHWEQWWISEDVGWKGWWSFVYLEMARQNEIYTEEITWAKTSKELVTLWEEIKATGFVSYYVNTKSVDENIEEFQKLDIESQKEFLISILDKNLLYQNYSEMNDKNNGVTTVDKKLNDDFYKG